MKIFHTDLPTLTKWALLCLVVFMLPNQSFGGEASFEWTPNPEPLTGYKLYYKLGDSSTPPYDGTGLNEGDSPITLGKVTEYTVTGLSDDKTYYFALTAYNEEEESGYSELVMISSDPIPIINSISQN